MIVFLFLDWEARMDCHGRVFYIDHQNHKTTWQKPSTTSSPGGSVPNSAVLGNENSEGGFPRSNTTEM